MLRLLLDGNIFDRLRDDVDTRARLAAAVRALIAEVIVTPTLRSELAESPFRGVPDWFPVTHVGESVAFAGGHIGDRVGSGAVYMKHRGKSKKHSDALIADAADWDADFLVSEDGRLVKRANQFMLRAKAVRYGDLVALLASYD